MISEDMIIGLSNKQLIDLTAKNWRQSTPLERELSKRLETMLKINAGLMERLVEPTKEKTDGDDTGRQG